MGLGFLSTLQPVGKGGVWHYPSSLCEFDDPGLSVQIVHNRPLDSSSELHGSERNKWGPVDSGLYLLVYGENPLQ